MIRQIGASALFAGLAAGVLAALLQFWFVVPLLMEAELYESGARSHFTDGYIGSDAGTPPLGDALARHAGTLAMNVVAWIGFGLVMAAGFALAHRRGVRTDARTGLLWGLGGFTALALAPSFGLPPELPGTIAAEVSVRQVWWGFCVIATAAGLGVMAFGRGPLWLGAGGGADRGAAPDRRAASRPLFRHRGARACGAVLDPRTGRVGGGMGALGRHGRLDLVARDRLSGQAAGMRPRSRCLSPPRGRASVMSPPGAAA
ncbi:CbtA family protein [Limimaricola hongkongensis]|uniref:CbtA family protein n=1 Tax=Limimaricola hongkongensis TaxID=278132 RepID=UPI000A9223D7